MRKIEERLNKLRDQIKKACKKDINIPSWPNIPNPPRPIPQLCDDKNQNNPAGPGTRK